MTLQPIVDQLPLVLVGIGIVLAAMAYLLRVMGERKEGQDAFDDWADRLEHASNLYSKAIDWLDRAGALGKKGDQKLELLRQKVSRFELLWRNRKYADAFAELYGFYQAARDKVSIAPFATTGSGAGGTISPPADAGSEDPDPTTDLDNTPASQ